VVRAVLLPSVMQLLGERDWYLPRWLEWLPTLRHDTVPTPVPAPAVPIPAQAGARRDDEVVHLVATD
jgi:RND superfamily putative drug exporter